MSKQAEFGLLLGSQDMRGAPVAIMVVLIVGVLVLRRVRPPTATSKSRIWVPIAALLSGPLIAINLFVADVMVISRDYITLQDYTQTLSSMLIIGVIAGVVGAAGIWFGDRWPARRGPFDGRRR